VSAGVAVPVFALAATGVPIAAAADAIDDRIAVAVFAGLVIGKTVGIFGAARLTVRLGLARLPANVQWADVLPVAVLGSIGYTVSLLITQLALPDVDAQNRVAASILAAAVITSAAAVILIRRRPRRPRRREAGGQCSAPQCES
jgi:NhaA family Na+:H+ antiporter